jgi:outer membrane protein OmpA-like peptidoglycan-associated protein
MRLRLPLVLSLVSAIALAETSTVNIHVQPGVGLGLDKNVFISGANLKVDTTAITALGPVSPQLELYGLGAFNSSYLDQGSEFGVGLGLRLRIANDEQGYLFNPGSKHVGNLWGNYWIDAHGTYSSGGVGFGFGFDAATGIELSLLEGLSVGPFAQFRLAGIHQMALFGLSFTIGAPQKTPDDADYDSDGIKGDNDKCPEEAEDKDGFEDTDGCPELDNDKDGVNDDKDKCADKSEDKDKIQDEDGCPETDADNDTVLDEKDKCPTFAGVVDNNGCPDDDKDGDTVVDRLDKCPEVKGEKDNAGCPDVDTDGDTVVDRLDKCPAEKGTVELLGCPVPDSDKDGVADDVDNCPKEVGPATNQGCPEAQKQLVVITKERLVIKEKVFFDTGKATIQKRSNALLDQVATILNAHIEIDKVNIEGHTDSTGNADKNRVLSLNRAKSVVAYLVKKGVAESRLAAFGFGPDKPADSNVTAVGRENNRRVEFNIVGDAK